MQMLMMIAILAVGRELDRRAVSWLSEASVALVAGVTLGGVLLAAQVVARRVAGEGALSKGVHTFSQLFVFNVRNAAAAV